MKIDFSIPTNHEFKVYLLLQTIYSGYIEGQLQGMIQTDGGKTQPYGSAHQIGP